MRRRLAFLLVGPIVVACVSPALALPTMIRLGYTDCASCHFAPQGGGPLKPYGRTIDEAQSLRGGEYRPRDKGIVRALSWDRRIAQDFRLVLPVRWAWAAHQSADATFPARLQYRNFTALPGGFAAHATITGEADSVPRPDLLYDPSAEASPVFVNIAVLHYRVTHTLEIAAGRDQLPTGLNLPDPRLFIKARTRSGWYDTPTQIKVYWAGKRYRVTPFVYAPGGNEAPGEGESGGGALAELDVLSNHRAVVGVHVLRGSATNGNRRMAGVYARLGFGPWGILAEHDVTDRDRDALQASFRQHTSFGQIFWAPREWLVASAIVERLSVQEPFRERLNAGAIDVTARLTSVATIGASARLQRDAITDQLSRSVVVQLTLKTVY
jgi:hypothetical protein